MRQVLRRIKKKYRSAGRPTYTKLDLATRVREDGLLRYALGAPGSRQNTGNTRAGQRPVVNG